MARNSVSRKIRAAGCSSGSFCLFIAALFFLATNSDATDLITEPVSAARLSALPQHRVDWGTAANDLGDVADDLPLHLTVVLKRSAQKQGEFEQFLREQQDPASPNFHHWLTPVEIGERFGASSNDIDALTQWLQSQGLHVDAVANSRARIDFSGPAAAVGTAFASPMHTYLVNGEKRVAPAGVPQIPAALSTIVRSVRGLVTINETSQHGARTGQLTGKLAPVEAPGATFCSGNVCTNYITPADFAAIYNLNSVYQQGIDGTGQTIAIIGRARVSVPDIENFQLRSGLAIKDPIIVIPPGGIDPGPALSSGGSVSEDQLEATIDVTRATSVAPGATIHLVVSGTSSTRNGIAIASQYVVDTNPPPAQIMSISFGACERNAGQSGVDFYDSLFSQAAAEGISVFAISGDSGAAGCDPYNATPPAIQLASANYLCTSSYATCVGGTQFADVANPCAYWRSSNSSGLGSALGYIPEGAWNEPLDGNGNPQASASGGGPSIYVPRPSWQNALGVPGTQGRYTPDVSFSASQHDGYFGCLAAAGSSCATDGTGHFRFEYFYGTSASTPSMAGIAALLNQKMGRAQGNLNPRLYALAASPGNGVFHDVTVATSGVSGCDVSTPSMCNNSTPGPGGLSGGFNGYSVGPGYDAATGLGSIDVANLLVQWAALGDAMDLNQHGLTGSWYEPATSGQGVEVEVFPNPSSGTGSTFVSWFTYDTVSGGADHQRWYTAQGQVVSGQPSAALTIYQNTGGNFNAPPITNSQAVGTATLSFDTCSSGQLSYAFTDGTGRAGTIPLTRLTQNVTCSTAPPYPTNGDFALSGNWYSAATSGQGFTAEVNPNSGALFAAWYTYMPNGTAAGAVGQRWYTALGSFTPGMRSIPVTIYETTGGMFDTPTPPNQKTVAVGTGTMQFQSCAAATFSYNFTGGTTTGFSGTIALSRVGPLPPGC